MCTYHVTVHTYISPNSYVCNLYDCHVMWFSFGRNAHGELGRPSRLAENADVRPLQAPEGLQLLVAGQFHSLGLAEGICYGWGTNSEGQLALQGEAQVPTRCEGLEALLGEEKVKQIAAGRCHSAPSKTLKACL